MYFMRKTQTKCHWSFNNTYRSELFQPFSFYIYTQDTPGYDMCCTLDFAKAFDTRRHSLFCPKLQKI